LVLKVHTALDVAAEYFRSGADKVSIGSESVFAAEAFIATGQLTGKTGIEQISYR
jgi:glutamine amidotransferase/cyclase